MSDNKYIGARYVPIFDGAWDSTKSYEPLVIVEHQGNSYTSKTYVPTGVAIDDTTYWALTGNYNAQVEQYRKEVVEYSKEVADCKDSFTEKFAEFRQLFEEKRDEFVELFNTKKDEFLEFFNAKKEELVVLIDEVRDTITEVANLQDAVQNHGEELSNLSDALNNHGDRIADLEDTNTRRVYQLNEELSYPKATFIQKDCILRGNNVTIVLAAKMNIGSNTGIGVNESHQTIGTVPIGCEPPVNVEQSFVDYNGFIYNILISTNGNIGASCQRPYYHNDGALPSEPQFVESNIIRGTINYSI